MLRIKTLTRVLLGALTLAVLVSAPMAANAGGDSDRLNPQDPIWRNQFRSEWNNPTFIKHDRVTNSTDADDALEEQVSSAVNSYWIDTVAEKGIVTLSGTVDTMAERDAAIAAASSVPGVRYLNAKLGVRELPDETPHWRVDTDLPHSY